MATDDARRRNMADAVCSGGATWAEHRAAGAGRARVDIHIPTAATTVIAPAMVQGTIVGARDRETRAGVVIVLDAGAFSVSSISTAASPTSRNRRFGSLRRHRRS